MALLQLDDRWTTLMDRYRADHQHPINRACHKVGIPLIIGSLPMAVCGLRAAAVMFTIGWGFQLLGHAFEGNRPSFMSDKRLLVVGALWWLETVGLVLADRAPLRAPDPVQSPASPPEPLSSSP